jgi:plasmid replication initiation protein
MLVRIYSRVNLAIKKKANGNIRNVMSRWVSQIAYNDNEATVDLIFAPAVVPL